MIDGLSYALLGSLILSAALVPVTALAMRRATLFSGAVRHRVWCLVLASITIAPLAEFTVSVVRPPEQLVMTASTAASVLAAVHGPKASQVLLAALLVCWLPIATMKLGLIARRIVALRDLKRRATWIDVRPVAKRRARVLISNTVVPAAIGFLHPAILLPLAVIETLDSRDAQLAVAHEVAHLRRWDDFTGLIYEVAAAIFWFNPLIYYIGRNISMEREIACDEIVISETGETSRYAKLLVNLAQRTVPQRLGLAWSALVRTSELAARLSAMLRDEELPRRTAPWPAQVALIGVLISSVGAAALGAPAIGHASLDTLPIVRPLSGERARQDQEAMQVRVRDFPPCRVSRGLYAREAARIRGTYCEATAGSPISRIGKPAVTS